MRIGPLLTILLAAANLLAQSRPSAGEAGQWLGAQRAYPAGRVPEDAAGRAMAQRLALERVTVRSVAGGPSDGLPNGVQAATTWSELGPHGVSGAEGIESGHVTAIVTDQRNPEAIYVAASGGGVWHSPDGGTNWRPLTDNLLSLMSGSLALDERTGMLFYGTGDQWSRESAGLYGAGVFRSADGGATWINANGWDPDNSRPNFSGGITPRILLSPVDPRTVYVGRNSGLWRTTDNGESWFRLVSGSITDVAIDPLNANRMFAALGNFFGDAGNGIYRSIDAGRTWGRMAGLPFGLETGRISFALAPSNPLTMYAAFERSSDRQLLGAYRSLDGGNTWTRIPAPSTLFDSAGRGQGFFDNYIAVHPRDSNVLYLGGVELWKSSDSGATWRNLSLRDGRRIIHEDQFCLAFKPGNPETVYVGNEGGIYRSTDGGSTWQSLNAGLAITQFNSIAVRPAANLLDQPMVLGGTQGQGLVRFRGATQWSQLFRGDGGAVVLDPANPDLLYSTRQRLQPMRSVDGGNTFSSIAGGIEVRDRISFYPPLVSDASNPSVLYFATHRLWISSNGGANWATITTDLTNGGTVTALAAGDGLVFSGSSDGVAAVSSASGVLRTGTGLPNRWITSIALAPRASSAAPVTAYLTVSGFGSGHVFRTTDSGATWTDVSGNLPDSPANAVAVDPSGPIYAATDVGVFRTEDGASWTSFNNGLPNSFVMALAADARSRTLTAATYGRGVFQTRLQDPATGPNVLAAGVVNAATFRSPLAPGMIASLFGSRLAAAPVSASAGSLPTTLGGTTVTVNGLAAPLFFVSPGQINFQVPFETPNSAVIQVTTAEGSASVLAAVSVAAPGIFSGTLTHAGTGAPVTAANRAVPGEILTVYATGLGLTAPAVATGAVAPGNPPATTRSVVTANVGGRAANVLFAGLVPGFVGLYQVNLQVPEGVSGDVPLTISAADRPGNTVTLLAR